MNELGNELSNRIYYLSALVSYPLCDSLIDLTNDLCTIKILMDGLAELIDADLEMAYLLFQVIMAIAGIEIPAQIKELSQHPAALRLFMCELFWDLDDYYELARVESDDYE